MRYNVKQEWRDADFEEIEFHRDSIVYFQALDLRHDNQEAIDKAIAYHERELNECIRDFEVNYPTTKTPKISFAESIDGLTKAWERSGVANSILA